MLIMFKVMFLNKLLQTFLIHACHSLLTIEWREKKLSAV